MIHDDDPVRACLERLHANRPPPPPPAPVPAPPPPVAKVKPPPAPLPLPPDLTLPTEVRAVVAFVAWHYALHVGVALTAVLTVLGALLGGSRRLSWRDEEQVLDLKLVLLPAVAAEVNGWQGFLCAPLSEEVARRRSCHPNTNGLITQLREVSADLKKTPEDAPHFRNLTEAREEILEMLGTDFYLTAITPERRPDYHGSTLLCDPTPSTLGLTLT